MSRKILQEIFLISMQLHIDNYTEKKNKCQIKINAFIVSYIRNNL